MTIATAPVIDPQPLLLNVSNTTLTVTPAQFDLLCVDNPDLRLELTPNRELIVMAPAGGESSKKNLDLAIDVGIWNRQTNLGEAFDSSGGYDFTALGGGKPAPDVSWIEKSRLEGVNIVGFIPVVPDFVIELRSLEKVLHLRRFYSGVPPVGVASPTGDIRKRQDRGNPKTALFALLLIT